MREHEVQMSKRKPLYIKAKERTSHVLKRLEASKYAVCSLHIIYDMYTSLVPCLSLLLCKEGEPGTRLVLTCTCIILILLY